MATENALEQIGETAGLVWKTLNENSPLSIAKLTKQTGAQRELVLMAIGWLAREDKIVIEDQPRGRQISLR